MDEVVRLKQEIEKLRKEIKRKDSALRRIKQRSGSNKAVYVTADIALKPPRNDN